MTRGSTEEGLVLSRNNVFRRYQCYYSAVQKNYVSVSSENVPIQADTAVRARTMKGLEARDHDRGRHRHRDADKETATLYNNVKGMIDRMNIISIM